MDGLLSRLFDLDSAVVLCMDCAIVCDLRSCSARVHIIMSGDRHRHVDGAANDALDCDSMFYWPRHDGWRHGPTEDHSVVAEEPP